MDVAEYEAADARDHMVDCQLRPNKVSDPRILAAMRSIPRERFLPPELACRAYVDEDVPLANGRVLIEPLVIARLIQLAAPTPTDRVLIVAAGTGYGAAVMAACTPHVIALEQDPDLLKIAWAMLPSIARSVAIIQGKLDAGWPQESPYDIVLLEGAVHDIPAALGRQLNANGGRLVTVMAGRGRVGTAVLAEPTPVGLRAQPAFDCATPLIPSLLPPPKFEF